MLGLGAIVALSGCTAHFDFDKGEYKGTVVEPLTSDVINFSVNYSDGMNAYCSFLESEDSRFLCSWTADANYDINVAGSTVKENADKANVNFTQKVLDDNDEDRTIVLPSKAIDPDGVITYCVTAASIYDLMDCVNMLPDNGDTKVIQEHRNW